MPIQQEFQKKLANKKGVMVFASSSGIEVSEEVESAQHGAYTTALTAAVSGKADKNDDGNISVKELTAYVRKSVSELTSNRQHPYVVVQQLNDEEVLFDSNR